jgi:SAM-dependent methyltransferase
LGEAIRTGKPVHRPDPHPADPEDLELYVRGLHELALASGDARHLARVLPLQDCRTLLDLGDGPGTYAAMLCRSFPKLQATVAVSPRTLEITRHILHEFDLTGNVGMLAADVVRDPIPGGPYDAVLISNLLNCEDEQTNALVLRKVRDGLAPGGLLIVKAHCMSADRTAPEQGAVFALSLLLATRGRTYSFKEMASWIEAAGLSDLVEIRPEPPMATSLLLALRPGGHPRASLPRPAAARPQAPAPSEPPALHDWWPANSSRDPDDGDFPSAAWMSSPAAHTPARRAAPARLAVKKNNGPGAQRSNSTSPQKRPAARSKVAAGRKSRQSVRSKRG